MARKHDLDLPALPALPAMHERRTHPISETQFTRRKLQGLLHIMTAELKARGTKTPHIFLPFRSRVDDTKLNLFLRRVFPDGVMVDTANKAIVRSLLDDFDEFTLICGLKYLWCRLPNNEIIGWPVYLEFKRKEQEAGYPKDAFLTIMPKCLSSSSHASIVYDFLDLMINIASNSQYNHLNGRKIAKMASIWAFKSTPASSSAFYDATMVNEACFLDGLGAWKKTCNGLFHLLLSFLRAMLPDTEAETLNLPKTLQSLLITNTYPPPESSNSVKSVITIPCVHVRSTRRSRDPYELISKVRHSLSFEKKDSFLSIENFTILKNIFQKASTAEIVSTLSEESRRVLTRLTAEPVPSEFDLYPGWARQPSVAQDPDIPSYSEVTISSVTLQDYFIWTWLSSLGSDQAPSVKSLFGRSIVVEAGLRGFQKWMVITETTIPSEEYISMFQSSQDDTGVAHYSCSPQISPLPKSFKKPHVPPKAHSGGGPSNLQVPLPPPPPSKVEKPLPVASDSPLPDVSFSNDHFSFEDQDFTSFTQEDTSPRSNYNNGLTQSFGEKMVISSKKASRPRPPPLDSPQKTASRQKRHPKPPPLVRDEPDQYKQSREDVKYYEYQSQDFPQMPKQYEEPYESYSTPFDRAQTNISSEPFDNYEIPVEKRRERKARKPEVDATFGAGADQPRYNAPHQNTAPEHQYNAPNVYPSMEKELPPIHPSNGSRKKINLPSSPEIKYDVLPMSEEVPQQMHGEDQYRNIDDMRHVSQHRQLHDNLVEQKAKYQDNVPNVENHETQPHYRENNVSTQNDYGNPFREEQVDFVHAPGEDKEKKKKKKKKSKKKELEAMMASIPDGPPPPLPFDGQSPIYYADAHGTRDHNSVQHEGQTHHQGFDNSPVHAQMGGSHQDLSPSEYYTPSSQSFTEPSNEFFPGAEPVEKTETRERPAKAAKEKAHKKSRSPRIPETETTHKYSEPYLQEPSRENGYLNVQPGHQSNSRQRLKPGDTHGDIHGNTHAMASPPPNLRYESQNAPPFNPKQRSESPVASSDRIHPKQYESGHGHPVYTLVDSRKGEQAASTKVPQGYENHLPVERTTPSPNPRSTHASRSPHAVGPEIQVAPAHYHASKSRGVEEPAYYQRPQYGHPESAGHVPSQRLERKSPSHSLVAGEGSGYGSSGYGSSDHGSQSAGHLPTRSQPSHGQPVHGPGGHSQPMPPMQGQPVPQYYYPPPQGYTPPQGYPPPPQGYAPPQGYPPQGYFPPQGYPYAQPPVMYYPPQGGYYPPPPQQGTPAVNAKPSTSELTMMNMPTANAFKKNAKPNKANLRAALNQGAFGI